MDNSFGLFSNSNCDKSPYIFPLYPIDEPYNIGFINCRNNNIDPTIFFPKDNNTINSNINNDFNKPTVPIKNIQEEKVKMNQDIKLIQNLAKII